MRALSNMPGFVEQFDTPEKCLKYLCNLKWSQGFVCSKCKHTECTIGRAWYYRRCKSCKKDESCTALTLFHKLKFPITSAFFMIHQLCTSKKGISCCELARQHNITLKTAWFFKRKVQRSMYEGKIEHFKVLFKKCERMADPVDSELLTVVVKIACSMDSAIKAQIQNIKSNVTYDENQKWNKALWTPVSSGKSKRRKPRQGFKVKVQIIKTDLNPETKLYAYRLKTWLAGIHHLVSLAHLQRYLQEFQYRYDNKHNLKQNPLELLRNFVKIGWLPFRLAKAQ